MNKRTTQHWLELFEQHKQSGLSAARFCRENNLCRKHFSKRRKQLLGDDKNTLKAFAPVRVQSRSVDLIRISYGAVKIHLPITIDSHWLASFIQQLPS